MPLRFSTFGCRSAESEPPLCDRTSLLGTWESGFEPGPAATVDATFTVDSLDALVACIEIDRVDPGGYRISTGWIAADGSYCG